MKVISFTALHYGISYLGWALKSVLPYVDECWILYSDIGSHGFHTDVPCPDKRDDLKAIAEAVAGDKLHWIDGRWQHEGFHRDAIFSLVPDATGVIVVDSDEIWSDAAIQQAVLAARYEQCRAYRVPFIHYWRSFYRGFLHDPSYPIRVICPQVTSGEQYLQTEGVINHMGYAQPAAIVEYKQLTHGHRGQWRTDCNWFQDKFMANAQEDCHPVGSEYWDVEPVDPWVYMPAFMHAHPFAQLEVIP